VGSHPIYKQRFKFNFHYKVSKAEVTFPLLKFSDYLLTKWLRCKKTSKISQSKRQYKGEIFPPYRLNDFPSNLAA
jgi:hypothetical protein